MENNTTINHDIENLEEKELDIELNEENIKKYIIDLSISDEKRLKLLDKYYECQLYKNSIGSLIKPIFIKLLFIIPLVLKTIIIA